MLLETKMLLMAVTFYGSLGRSVAGVGQFSFIGDFDQNRLRQMSYMCFKFKQKSEYPVLYTQYSLSNASAVKADMLEQHYVGHMARVRKIVKMSSSELQDTLFIPGVTLLSNCNYAGPNPAHFLFGLHAYFEWSLSKPPNLPAFNRVFFALCSPPKFNKLYWPWAKTVTDTFIHKMLKRNIITDKYRPYMEVNSTGPQFTCFEELYLHEDEGVLLSSEAVAREFRKAVVSPAVLHQHNAKHDYESATIQPSHLQAAFRYAEEHQSQSLKARCRNGALRIAFFMRNVDMNFEVIEQSVNASTRHPFFTISTDTSLSMDRQFLEFNSFDILISRLDPHLANMVLINHTRVGIVELGLAIRDDFWRINALQRLNLTSYTYSHGHTVDPACGESDLVRSYTRFQKAHGKDIHWDSNKAVQMPLAWKGASCNFIVNGTLLREHIARTVRALCAVA